MDFLDLVATCHAKAAEDRAITAVCLPSLLAKVEQAIPTAIILPVDDEAALNETEHEQEIESSG